MVGECKKIGYGKSMRLKLVIIVITLTFRSCYLSNSNIVTKKLLYNQLVLIFFLACHNPVQGGHMEKIESKGLNHPGIVAGTCHYFKIHVLSVLMAKISL